MDVASPIWDSDKKRNETSLEQHSGNQKEKHTLDGVEVGSMEFRVAGPGNMYSGNGLEPSKQHESASPESGKKAMNPSAAKNSSNSSRKRKKVASKPKGRRYLLRSSLDGVRVLRSRTSVKCTTPSNTTNTPVNPVTKRRKKRRKGKMTPNDEFLIIRKRVKYLLTRMNYEQNMIDAYSGEGWKGQSAEKIRPEKELARAKAEILRCKLKIRDLFRHLESLSSEGRFQESLFDSEGQICSEDIFCAKCGSKDLSADNDIILCDGICDRGFHQKCLNPPLLSEEIPLGDDGWLCPACDCKVDCIDSLSEFQGNNISLEETWEKVFPEAARIANGDKQNDLPSDDSEDDDYDPNVPKFDVENEIEESSSDESDVSSSSKELNASDHDKKNKVFGLPSDDSEDDDYDPDAPAPDKDSEKDGPSSDESDFTSDSDDFCAELSKISGANKDPSSSPSMKPIAQSGEGTSAGDGNTSLLNSGLSSVLETDLNQDASVLESTKRQLERLDYKKLYDETYGNTSSDSSDDEDWIDSSDTSTPKKGKKDEIRKESDMKSHSRTTKNEKSSRSAVGKQKLTDVSIKNSDIDQSQVSQEPDSKGNKSSSSVHRRLGVVATQKLLESFKENQYPTREKKECLAEELELTVRQVDKWFGNTRHSFRVSSKESSQAGVQSPDKETKSRRKGERSEKGETQNTAQKGKGKNPVRAAKSMVVIEHDNGNRDNVIETVDKDRQKAIARELRKTKKGR